LHAARVDGVLERVAGVLNPTLELQVHRITDDVAVSCQQILVHRERIQLQR